MKCFLFFSKSLICFDFVSSSTLEDFICEKGTVIDFESICAVACDVLGAIEGLQEVGILHNNITTQNILISQCPRVSKVVMWLAYVHVSSYMFATADFLFHRKVDNYIVLYSKVTLL